MASSQDRIAGQLDDAVHSLAGAWEGQAFHAFQGWEGKLAADLRSSAGACNSIAGQLEQTADYIDQANTRIHHLYEALAAAATVCIGLSIVTFGLSDAAGVAAAGETIAEATSIVEAVGTFLSGVASEMAAFAGRWSAAFALNIGVQEGINLAEGKSLVPSVDDVTEAVNFATTYAVIPSLPEGADAATKVVYPTVAGVFSGVTGAALTNAIDGDPLNGDFLKSVALTGGLGGVFGFAGGKVVDRFAGEGTEDGGGGEGAPPAEALPQPVPSGTGRATPVLGAAATAGTKAARDGTPGSAPGAGGPGDVPCPAGLPGSASPAGRSSTTSCRPSSGRRPRGRRRPARRCRTDRRWWSAWSRAERACTRGPSCPAGCAGGPGSRGWTDRSAPGASPCASTSTSPGSSRAPRASPPGCTAGPSASSWAA